jgi:hypothetical protein
MRRAPFCYALGMQNRDGVSAPCITNSRRCACSRRPRDQSQPACHPKRPVGVTPGQFQAPVLPVSEVATHCQRSPTCRGRALTLAALAATYRPVPGGAAPCSPMPESAVACTGADSAGRARAGPRSPQLASAPLVTSAQAGALPVSRGSLRRGPSHLFRILAVRPPNGAQAPPSQGLPSPPKIM